MRDKFTLDLFIFLRRLICTSGLQKKAKIYNTKCVNQRITDREREKMKQK